MAEPLVSEPYIHPPIGYHDQSETQERRVRGLSSYLRSNAGDLATRYGPDPLQDDPQAAGGGAAAGLPAGGVPAQALSAVAIGKKV
jgi:hypothetical protein